jgi:hypothetical protein
MTGALKGDSCKIISQKKNRDELAYAKLPSFLVQGDLSLRAIPYRSHSRLCSSRIAFGSSLPRSSSSTSGPRRPMSFKCQRSSDCRQIISAHTNKSRPDKRKTSCAPAIFIQFCPSVKPHFRALGPPGQRLLDEVLLIPLSI